MMVDMLTRASSDEAGLVWYNRTRIKCVGMREYTDLPLALRVKHVLTLLVRCAAR